jgi:hypothetical protein
MAAFVVCVGSLMSELQWSPCDLRAILSPRNLFTEERRFQTLTFASYCAFAIAMIANAENGSTSPSLTGISIA